MKRRLLTIMLILAMLCSGLLSSCSGGDEDAAAADDAAAVTETEGSSDETQDASSDSQGSGDWNDISDMPEIDISTLAGEDGVDVDLTVLSSTMVYAVVNDMMMRPNDYIGKTVKMNGTMSVYHDEDTGMTYYACLIEDATACCSQGIEFQTTEEFPPETYPAEGSEVTVTGSYDLYEDSGYQYCVLKKAVLG